VGKIVVAISVPDGYGKINRDFWKKSYFLKCVNKEGMQIGFHKKITTLILISHPKYGIVLSIK